MGLVASGKIAPNEWVESLVQLESSQLDEEPFGALVLIVRAPDDDESGQFLKQIVACVRREAELTGEHSRWAATTQFPTMRFEKDEPSEADQVELLSELSAAPHCIVPLRPTQDLGGFLIGRTPSATVCLSDPSVSSQHARVLLEDGGVRLVDLGSKNGTTLNGILVPKDSAPWLQPMDRITFGRIQAFACNPRVLRSVLRQDLRTLG